ncbi:MAG: AMP-binding protein [Bacillota bacterium]
MSAGNMTLMSCIVEDAAQKRPDFNILTFDYGDFPEEVVTYEDIYKKGCKIARLLQENGIGQGDRFALLMRNFPEFVYSLWAASATGAIVVPIDPRSKGDKLKYQLENSNSTGVIVAAEHLKDLEEAMSEKSSLKVLGVVYKDFSGVAVNEKYPVMNDILAGPDVPPPDRRKTDPDTPLELIYTSGTTGNPKGVVVKESRLATYALLARMIWQYSETDILYTGLSLTHGNAQAVTLIPSLSLGIPAVIGHKFTKSRIWDVCRKYGCTTFSLLGGMMMGIYSEPQRDNDGDNPVRKVISAGTPPSIWTEFENRFNVKIHEWYGAVEGGFAHNPPGVGPVGSFGKTLDGMMEMKVVREDDTECEPGEIGELICRMVTGDNNVEYFGNKKASEEKTRGGWLRTGDMCHRDKDGWFYFDFRAGGGLRRQGDFIQPDFVEKVIARHPDVSDVCVYGIPAASGAPGESDLVAAVVPFAGKQLDPKSVFDACLAGLERNSVPTYIQVVDEIPKTASEKNLDRVLRESFSPDAANVYKYL